MLKELVSSYPARALLSILWGLALACFFRRQCTGKRCIVIEGPPPGEVEGKVYSYGDGSCYSFKPRMTACEEEDHTTVRMQGA